MWSKRKDPKQRMTSHIKTPKDVWMKKKPKDQTSFLAIELRFDSGKAGGKSGQKEAQRMVLHTKTPNKKEKLEDQTSFLATKDMRM